MIYYENRCDEMVDGFCTKYGVMLTLDECINDMHCSCVKIERREEILVEEYPMIPESEWVWLGYADHSIIAQRCLFHMTTEVGKYLISTVGDYRNPVNNEREKIGCGRFFETYVFDLTDKICGCGCGKRINELGEIDGEGANDPLTAKNNHMKMCYKYAKIGGK